MATQVIRGNGSPEGFVKASRGTFYINTQSSSVFVKIKGDSSYSNGWRIISITGYFTGEESPEGVVYAPLGAIYYDTLNDILYMQMKSGEVNLNEGWVPLNTGNLLIDNGNPNTDNIKEGFLGDLYINEVAYSLFLHTGKIWELINLMVVESTDVMLKVSELMTNTTNINRQFFNMFFNPEPMDIEVSQYDENSILKTYTIPNRAKDSITMIGEENPEGKIFAIAGQFYLDIITGTPYIKTTDMDQNIGWSALNLPNFKEGLYYNDKDNSLEIACDEVPTENSTNMLNSHTLYNELNTIRNGNPDELFSVAEPIESEHATSKGYVDSMHANMFGYDTSTKTLYINAPLSTDITEEITLMAESETPITGVLFTPMFGSGYSTVLTFTNPIIEEENTNVYIQTEMPCTVRFTTASGYYWDVELPYGKMYDRCFNDTDEEMKEGIKTMQIIEVPLYRVALVENIKDIFKGTRFTVVEIEPEEEV